MEFITFYRKGPSVSILVLLEVPLRLAQDTQASIANLEFQSLFCWKFLLGRRRGSLSGWICQVVSILVLLEVPLRRALNIGPVGTTQ